MFLKLPFRFSGPATDYTHAALCTIAMAYYVYTGHVACVNPIICEDDLPHKNPDTVTMHTQLDSDF